MEQRHPLELFFSSSHPMSSYLTLEYRGKEDGLLSVALKPPADFVVDRETGTVHSGFATLVLDTVLGGTVLGHIELKQPVATVGLTTQHMRRARLGEDLVCRTRLEGVHRDIAHVSGQLVVADTGEVLSTATGAFMIGTRAKPLGARL